MVDVEWCHLLFKARRSRQSINQAMPLHALLSSLLLALMLMVGESVFQVKFIVSNLDGESPTELHDFTVEVHPEWVGALADALRATCSRVLGWSR